MTMAFRFYAMQVMHATPRGPVVRPSLTKLATVPSDVPFLSGRTFSDSARNSKRKLRRRPRTNFGRAKFEGNGPPKHMPEITGLQQPYDGLGSEDYHKKASLSPWVPIPDPIARKLFDMSAPTPEDVHVELGCGDGRVNFYAIDHGKVKKSTGIDVDDGILDMARERLGKRYPQPPIEFITADLLEYDTNSSDATQKVDVWGTVIPEATILTMYFVEEALQKIRPRIEEALVGKTCKIITCAYEMKGWTPTIIETTLGTTVYLYEWGMHASDEEGCGSSDNDAFFFEDSLLHPSNRPEGLTADPLQELRARGEEIEHIERLVSFIPDRSKPDPMDLFEDDDTDDDDDDDTDAIAQKYQQSNHNPSKINLAEAHKKTKS